MKDQTTPNEATIETEEQDAKITSGADRAPTPEEERDAEGNELDPEVAAAYKEALERGANVSGEGAI